MMRTVQTWSVSRLCQERGSISFPEYQREPNLWPIEKKRLLVDSILRDIDIPKLYFNRTPESVFEVIDGQQRLWALWGFFDNEFAVDVSGLPKKYAELDDSTKKTFDEAELQVVVLRDASDDYLRTLFLRLQLGLLLIAGEKLNASKGRMKDFLFRKAATQPLIENLGVPRRRYSGPALCAQIAINSFSRAKSGEFSRTRYQDLETFVREYADPVGLDAQYFREGSSRILAVMSEMHLALGKKAKALKSRSLVLSLYLVVEEVWQEQRQIPAEIRVALPEFVSMLTSRLREESRAGLERSNRDLYELESLLSSAPGEKYQIERRHLKLKQLLANFVDTGVILGDSSKAEGPT